MDKLNAVRGTDNKEETILNIFKMSDYVIFFIGHVTGSLTKWIWSVGSNWLIPKTTLF